MPPVLSSADALVWLRRELANPPFTCSVKELAEFWSVECLRIECVAPAGLEDHPELSLRVRGAFGRQLHALPAGRTTTGAHRTAAWDVLAEPLARLPEGDEVPKPVVVRAGMAGTNLIVEMRLLGRASAWFDEAATAMTRALEGGIDLLAVGGLRVPIAIDHMIDSRLMIPVLPEGVTTAALIFRSPVLARHRHQLAADPRSILRGIVRRVTSLARWQATRVEDDWPRLLAAIEAVSIDDHDLVPFRWQRYSIRSGNKPIPTVGWLGTLRLNGHLDPLVPYLALAETMNAGAQASLGLGWFELAMA